MTSTIAILWNTFGLMGLASAVAWAAALTLLLAGAGSRRRFSRWLVASAAAAAGLVLALATSESIRGIDVDRSAEVTAAEAAALRSTQEKLRGRAANIRFAEDTATDQADVAGVTVAEEKGAYERAVEEQLEKIPAYRARGKKSRSQGRPAEDAKKGDGSAASKAADAGTTSGEAKPAGKDGLTMDDAATKAATGDHGSARPARSLPESQLIVADRFDRGNRAIAWTVLAFAVGLVGAEYVRRFNSPFDPVWPVPLAGTPLDGLTGKEHVTTLPPGGPAAMPAWLESLARKGESFLVFAAADPLTGQADLPRISAGRLRLTTPVRKFPAAELVADPSLLELAFESAWFGRGSTVILGRDAAGEVLSRFATALASRRRCRAAARRTLGIVWAIDAAPPAEAAATIERLATATNVRWTRPENGLIAPVESDPRFPNQP